MTGLAGGIESAASSHRNEPAPESLNANSESANNDDRDTLVFVIPVESDGIAATNSLGLSRFKMHSRRALRS